MIDNRNGAVLCEDDFQAAETIVSFFAICWWARYKEYLIWMFRCLYAYEVKCKQRNNKVGSLSAP